MKKLLLGGFCTIALSSCQTVQTLDQNLSECLKDFDKCVSNPGQNKQSNSSGWDNSQTSQSTRSSPSSNNKSQQSSGKTSNSTTARNTSIVNYPTAIVEQVQRKLNSLGYHAGSVDGLFGGQTQKAVTKYQKDNRLEATGKLDKDTLNRLAITTQNVATNTAETSAAPKDENQAILQSKKRLSQNKDEQPPSQSVASSGAIKNSDTKVLTDKNKAAIESTTSANTDTQVGAEPTELATAIVKASETNLKSEANAFSSTIETLNMNTSVSVLNKQNEWTQVRVNDSQGFIYTDDLQF